MHSDIDGALTTQFTSLGVKAGKLEVRVASMNSKGNKLGVGRDLDILDPCRFSWNFRTM